MTVADDGLIRPLIGFALDLVATVAFDSLNEAISDTHNNTSMVGSITCILNVVLKKYLVTDFWSFVKASCSFIILECKAAASA